MTQRAFRSLYWGFLFIMIDFRLQGIDVLPDIIGYAFFNTAISGIRCNLVANSSAIGYYIHYRFANCVASANICLHGLYDSLWRRTKGYMRLKENCIILCTNEEYG